MKQLINPRLGAATILVFIWAASILSSCQSSTSNSDGSGATPKPPVMIFYDSSNNGGSGSGVHPHEVKQLRLTISCPTVDCALWQPGSDSTMSSNDSTNVVFEATTTNAIPANTKLRMNIVVVYDQVSDTAMKK